jgi:hypothetical protein
MVQLKAKAGIDVTDLGILDFTIERLVSTLFWPYWYSMLAKISLTDMEN